MKHSRHKRWCEGIEELTFFFFFFSCVLQKKKKERKEKKEKAGDGWIGGWVGCWVGLVDKDKKVPVYIIAVARYRTLHTYIDLIESETCQHYVEYLLPTYNTYRTYSTYLQTPSNLSPHPLIMLTYSEQMIQTFIRIPKTY